MRDWPLSTPSRTTSPALAGLVFLVPVSHCPRSYSDRVLIGVSGSSFLSSSKSRLTRMASSETVPVTPSSSKNFPGNQMDVARTQGSSPIVWLSVELIQMIAWSLPRPDVQTMEMPMEAVEAWKAEQEDHGTALPPRPQELYPLARACKAFWQCPRPPLYRFDVILPTMMFKLVSDPSDWVLYARSSEGSALSWGIQNNKMNTVKLAVETARAVGDLGIYGAITHRRPSPGAARGFNCRCCRSCGRSLSSGSPRHAPVVELLTEDADVSTLNQTLSPHNTHTSSWLSYVAHLHGLLTWTNMDITALHVAIMLGHADIVEIPLTRYSHLDQSTLEWYEPTSLQMAAYIGDAKMATLILDGSSPDSPWTVRAQNQLVDPRANDKPTTPHLGKLWPPMMMAFMSMRCKGWRPEGDGIFSFLAARGGQHLLTEPFNMSGHESNPPLDFVLLMGSWAGWLFELLEDPEARIIALIKASALAIRTTQALAPPATVPHSRVQTIYRLWVWYEGLYESHDTSPTDDRAPQVKFMGECWDAAVEQCHGEIDAQFVDVWARGIGPYLPDLGPSDITLTYPYDEYDVSTLRNELEAHVSLSSPSSSPRLRALPSILRSDLGWIVAFFRGRAAAESIMPA